MPKTKEDFQPDTSGGFLDGSDGDIVAAEFVEASEDYAKKMATGGASEAPAIGLNLTIESPDLQQPLEQWFSIGSGDVWEIKDGGKEIVNTKHPDRHSFRGGKRPCRGSSLVEAMAKAIGDGNVDKGQEFFIKRDRYMTEKGFYVGLSFDWGRFTLPTAKEGTTSDVPLPVAFLGEASGGKPAKAEATVDTEAIEKLVIDIVQGKTEREVKSELIRKHKNDIPEAYMKELVSGNGLKKLEEEGKITKDAEGADGKYL